MPKFQPKDIIALTVLILIAVLKFNGFDGELDTAGALILGYYFAKRSNGEDRGK